MKRIPILLLFGQLLINSPSYSQNENSASMGAIDSYFKKLESFGLSGSILIGNKDQILLKKNYGFTNQSDKDLAYSVGSITKQFTATGILKLEEGGLLSTDDKITAHLEGIPEDKRNITIHQLLTHTSGLHNPYWDSNPDLSEYEYIQKELAEELDSEPGTRFKYSNFGYHLLAKIIEGHTSKPYEQFLIEDLFEPNGIQSTGFNLVKWKKNQVVNYNDWTTERTEPDITNPLNRPIYLQPEGSGAIFSTTQDLYKWYQLLFNSSELLTQNSKKKLFTVEKANYGYGWEIYDTQRGTKLIEHGGYDSWLGVIAGFYNFIEEDRIVIFLGNTHMSEFLSKDEIMDTIESILFSGFVKMAPSTTYTLEETDLEKYCGEYNSGTVSIAKGKIANQLRLRTEDRELIKKIIFPQILKSETVVDWQIANTLDHMNRDDFDPLRNVFFEGPSFEKIKSRYRKLWEQLTDNYGSYIDMNVFHIMPNIYQGKFELQILAELRFENGTFLLRCFRNHKGQLHFQSVHIPDMLELYLSPSAKDEFISYNVKFGTSSSIKLKNEILKVNGHDIVPTISITKIIRESYLANGIDYIKQNFTELTGSNMTDSSVLNEIGYLFMEKKSIDQALEIFGLNTKLFAEDPNVWDSLGEAYLEKGNEEKALEFYKKALSIDPYFPSAQKMVKELEEK